jgi:hypothetical protein
MAGSAENSVTTMGYSDKTGDNFQGSTAGWLGYASIPQSLSVSDYVAKSSLYGERSPTL